MHLLVWTTNTHSRINYFQYGTKVTYSDPESNLSMPHMPSLVLVSFQQTLLGLLTTTDPHDKIFPTPNLSLPKNDWIKTGYSKQIPYAVVVESTDISKAFTELLL